MPARPRAAYRRGIAVVRQHTELCDNLDVAANLFLGREGRGLFFDHTSLHTEPIALLQRLRIPLSDTTTSVGSLSGGMRQLLAVARAMLDQPRLLILDEPTFSLGVNEGAQVEELMSTLREQGTTVLLVSHDVDQMFRLADRIVVLRHGRVIADIDPRASHRDDVVALLSGQQADSSARRQLEPAPGPGGPARLHRPVLEPVGDPVVAGSGAQQPVPVDPPEGGGAAALRGQPGPAAHAAGGLGRGALQLQPRARSAKPR